MLQLMSALQFLYRASANLDPEAQERWRCYYVQLLHRVALGLYMLKRRVSQGDHVQDLDVLETVADIMTSILESRWWLAQHVKANLPPPLLQPAPTSFRQQAMASEMSTVFDHMQRNPLAYSSPARKADTFR
ncbi:unnamed protein product, partial [Symbiodinium necroappetens]